MMNLIVTFHSFVQVPKIHFTFFFPNFLVKNVYETAVFQFIYKV
jgi:hypothetical protein